MVKAIKIALGQVSEVEADTDQELKEMRVRRGGTDSWALCVPERWEHKKFKLSMTTVGFFTESDDYNLTATYLWKHLRTGGAQPILGTVFIYNESDEAIIDMTMSDFQYLMAHIPKYGNKEN